MSQVAITHTLCGKNDDLGRGARIAHEDTVAEAIRIPDQ